MQKTIKADKVWAVLSVQNPWSDLICRGLKDVENRSWSTDYRGRLYIHSSGSPMTPSEAKHELRASVLRDIPEVRSWLQEGMSKGATESWLTSRAIIGYVELVDCVRDSTSPWAEEDQYHWVFADPDFLTNP